MGQEAHPSRHDTEGAPSFRALCGGACRELAEGVGEDLIPRPRFPLKGHGFSRAITDPDGGGFSRGGTSRTRHNTWRPSPRVPCI